MAPLAPLPLRTRQFYLTPKLSFLAKFDREFASNSQTYAGTGTLRYAW
jgi:hypothetical protein